MLRLPLLKDNREPDSLTELLLPPKVHLGLAAGTGFAGVRGCAHFLTPKDGNFTIYDR